MRKTSYLNSQPSQAPKFIGLSLLLAFVFALGWNTGISHTNQVSSNGSGTVVDPNGNSQTIDMQLFWDTWDLINARYVEPQKLDYKEMVFGAIHGMVAAIQDPYTGFMTPKENKEFQDSLDGTLEGIGAELTLREGLLTVVSPLKDSPAQKAGLQPEDIIYKINDEVATDFALEQAVLRIRGPRGTSVKLTIIREGVDEPFDVNIIRNTINVESVELTLKDYIAVLELNQFGNHTLDEFNRAINEIMKSGAKGLVLDLRFNGGGFLDGAIDVASEFIRNGMLVTVKKRNPAENEVIFTNGKARLENIPMVVLINRGSASASEIVAGALQDHKRATVVGETSFGKGTVQEVIGLIGGASLRVTVAKWFTPADRDIDQVGIVPDVVIERTPEDFAKNRDPQMDKAIEILKEKP